MTADHLVAIIPLAQTVLWIMLIGWILHHFKTPIERLIAVVQDRIEGGSSVKAGVFSLGEKISPQPIETQKAEAEADAQEYIDSQSEQNSSDPSGTSLSPSRIVSEIFESQNLILRAIEEEFGKPIASNVRLLGRIQADGFFTLDGQLNIVEIKLTSPASESRVLEKTIAQFKNSVSGLNFRNVRLIICLVDRDTNGSSGVLSERVSNVDVPEEVLIFRFDIGTLKRRFGIT